MTNIMTEETVQISVQATKLLSLGDAHEIETNAISVVTLLPAEHTNNQPRTLGETEIIKNCLNPRWNKKFYLNYKPDSKPTYFLVKIFNKVSENEFKELASGVFDIRSVLQAPDNLVTKKLKNDVGSIHVRVEKVVGEGSLHLEMNGTSLKPIKKGFRTKIRPVYQFSRKDVGPSGPEWNIVYRSDNVGNNSPSPMWEEEHIDLGRLCYNDADLPLRLSILHYRSSGKHSLIGELETSVNALIAASKSSSRLQISNNGAVTGRLNVLTASLSIAEKNTSQVLVAEKTVGSSLCLDVEEGDIYESLSSISTCPVADIPSTPCKSSSTSGSTPTSTPSSASASASASPKESHGPSKITKETSAEGKMFTSSSTINCY